MQAASTLQVSHATKTETCSAERSAEENLGPGVAVKSTTSLDESSTLFIDGRERLGERHGEWPMAAGGGSMGLEDLCSAERSAVEKVELGVAVTSTKGLAETSNDSCARHLREWHGEWPTAAGGGDEETNRTHAERNFWGGGGPSRLSFAAQYCMRYKSLCVELPKPPLTKPQPVEPPGDLNSTCSTRWICLASLPQRSRPIIGASPHRVAYPGTSKSSKARLIETHTNSLKHLLAKDGVIYNTLGHDHCC